MEKRYIDTHLLVDRYLQDSLDESEKADFEERLVWDEELVDEVELAEKLRNGLRQSVETGEYRADESSGSSILTFLRTPQYAAAASFLLAVAITLAIVNRPMMFDRAPNTGSVRKTEVMPLMALRSSDGPTLRINRAAFTVLLVDVVESHDTYRATLRSRAADNGEIWQEGGLVPNYLETLSIGIPGRLLAPGSYVMTIEGATVLESGESQYEHIQDLPFIAAPAE